MADKKPTEEQTNSPATEQVQEPKTEQTKEQKKLDKRSIIAIVAAIIGFLAILFGILAACGVFNKNTPEDNTAKITITIEVNGGTGNYNDFTFVLDENNTYTFTEEEKAAIKEALQRDGYELKGLSTTPDGEGGWTVTIPKDAESPVKLYAIWEEEPQPELAIFTHANGAITGLTDYGKTLSEITIPTTLDGEQITGIGSNAFKNNETITGVTIPSTVTGIGTGAFMGCKGLTSIKIPDGITLISHDTFAQCSSLTSIEIPGSLTNVGHGAFYGCPLTAVYFNGTSDEWNVYIDNSASSNGNFTTEIVYYYSKEKPTVEGKFWHYVEGVPTVWAGNVFITYYNGDEVELISYTLGAGESGIEKRVLQGDADEKFVGWFEEDAEEEFDYSSVTGGTYVLYAKWHDLITIDGETFEVECIDGYPLLQYEIIDEYYRLDLRFLFLNTTDGDRIELEEIRDRLTIVVDDGFYNYELGDYEVSITYGKHTKYNYTVNVDYSHE